MSFQWAEACDGAAYLGVTLLVLLLASLGGAPASPLTLILLTAGVVLFGLPHGALDVAVARNLLHSDRVLALTLFFAAYMFLAGIYATLWWWSPSLGLISFVAISAVHFGADWQRRGTWATRLAYGLTIVTLPSLFHAQQVQAIYSVLGDPPSTQLVQISRFAAVPAIATGLAAACFQWRARRRDLLEFLCILLSGMVLTPLLYFACYFCLLHSPRHLFQTAREQGLTRLTEIASAAAPATLVTVLAAWLCYSRLSALPAETALLRIIFIGLAALTVPHMLLSFTAARFVGSHQGSVGTLRRS